ncbi:MAG: aldehyde dehydrogenase family protein, partial [Burkholderiaceae bacterium]|nr:aldehyde dehydrogenase family protein [Burkholderiaceae bacterium]
MSTLEVVNPFDQKPIGSVDLVPWNSIDGWLADAHQLSRDRSQWLPVHQRIAILKNCAKLMSERAAELAHQIADEGGKPLIDARVEVARAIDGVELCIKELGHLVGTEVPMGLTPAAAGRLAFTTREPIGVVVAVSAFNHPLNLIVHQVAPAVAVGCPVLV